MKHVIRAHKSKIGPCSAKMARHQKPKPQPIRKTIAPKFRSRIYEHYIYDALNNRCKCRHCGSSLQRDSSNLRKHLQRMHTTMLVSDDEEENEVIIQKTSIWCHFKCLSRSLKIALCTLCDKRIDYGDEDELSTHLVENHSVVALEDTDKLPNLVVTKDGKIILVNDGNLKKESDVIMECVVSDQNSYSSHVEVNTQNDENDSTNTDTTYLDESLLENTHTGKPRHAKVSTPRNKTVYVHRPTKATKHDDSLDIFGKYITSLLRKLPEKTSELLQVDIVRQILTVESSRNTRSTEEAVSSNSGSHRVFTTDGNIRNMMD